MRDIKKKQQYETLSLSINNNRHVLIQNLPAPKRVYLLSVHPGIPHRRTLGLNRPSYRRIAKFPYHQLD